MTLRLEPAQRGLELDESYWSRNEPLIRGKLNLDFSVDPPPDLVIETEVSRTVLSRLDSLAALKVPEVWRFDGNQIWVGILQANGQYLWGNASLQFPHFPFHEIVRFLRMAKSTDHLSVLRGFQLWLREQRPT